MRRCFLADARNKASAKCVKRKRGRISSVCTKLRFLGNAHARRDAVGTTHAQNGMRVGLTLLARVQAVMERYAVSLVFLSLALFSLKGPAEGVVEKIKIDPVTRLYKGAQDGRVYTFHGLDTEDSSPPWYLRTLDKQQIDLMKTVRRSREMENVS